MRRARREPVVAAGGRTLLHVADAGPAATTLDLTGIDQVSYYEPADLIVTAGPGTTLAQLVDVLGASGQVLPAWHPAPDRATVGGLVAFGWSGLGRQLYGSLRDRVLEVRFVTGEGKSVKGGARVVKNVTGFDLPRLLFGSLGTLGVITELTLKVHPRPEPMFGGSVAGDSPGELARSVQAAADAHGQRAETILSLDEAGWRAFELVPGPASDAESLLAPLRGEPVGDADATFERLATDPVLCPAPGTGFVYRVAVPRSSVAELLARARDPVRAIVDGASGAAWIAARSESGVASLREWSESLGGSLVLLDAPDDVRRQLGTWGSAPPGAEIMRRIKAQLDPDGILSPGRYVV